MNNLILDFLGSLLSSDSKQKTTQTVLLSGTILLYAFGGLLFVDHQYLLAILCVVSGYALLFIRELLKDIFMKHGLNRKKS